MANRRFSSRRAFKPRRKLVWARHSDGIVIPIDDPAGTQNRYLLDDFETRYSADLIGITIMRIRGVITAGLVGDSDTLEGYAAIRCGIRVTDHADENQTDYTNDAMYDTQAYADWMMFEPFMLDALAAVASGDAAEATAASEIRRIDVKSRRKLGELGETLELVIGRPVAGGVDPPANTMAVRVRWDLSILVALP